MTPEQQKALREPFPPELVGTLPKGGGVRYVSHAHVTDRLLAVDPEWSWEPAGTDPSGLPALDAHGGLWIRLTVGGVTRYGYGDPQNTSSANAVKEAISDAIRNAAMRFGVALDLWMKDDADVSVPAKRDNPQNPQNPMMGQATQKQVGLIQALLKERGVTDREARLAGISKVVGREITTTNALSPGEAKRVIDVLKAGEHAHQ